MYVVVLQSRLKAYVTSHSDPACETCSKSGIINGVIYEYHIPSPGTGGIASDVQTAIDVHGHYGVASHEDTAFTE